MMGNSRVPCPREYFSYHTEYDRERGSHGGCGMFIRGDIAHTPITLQTPLQAVAVQLNLDRLYTVCSLYLPPNERISENNLSNLCQQLPQPFLLLGDMNGRHYMWGDSTANSRGDLLLSLIERDSLGILNTGEPTHFHIQTGTLSMIDLSVCSPNCLLDFSWEVDADRHGSDHFPIVIKTTDPAPLSRTPRWCLDKANWSLFRDLSFININADDLPCIDEAVQLLTLILYRAGLKSVPRTSGQFHRKPLPWWNLECQNAHRAMRAAFTRYRRHRYPHYQISFKKARSRFRRLIKKSRRESWIIFLSTIDWKTPLSQVWTKVKKIAGKYNPSAQPVLNINGSNVADPKIVSEKFAQHFAEVSKKNTRPPYHLQRAQEEGNFLDFRTRRSESYNIPFTMEAFVSFVRLQRYCPRPR